MLFLIVLTWYLVPLQFNSGSLCKKKPTERDISFPKLRAKVSKL